ncbi:MAG: methyltransferase domain-containing protein [Candidatus Krumholzibacteria bacterium]|jgi:SAM-dependent methyltransferase|nr:methyltransferase domain-containing protein [Candidatus Krumholzibacteria bacterium]
MADNKGIPANLSAGRPAGAQDLIIVRRHRLVRAMAPRPGGVLLDFGCGDGAQTLLFGNDFPAIIALDIGAGLLARLRDEAATRGLGNVVLPVNYDGRNIPLADGSVDFAVSFEVLEHVEEEARILAELARVTRPGGILAMSVPNRWWIFETHGANLPLLPWNRVPLFSWLPKGLHDRWARARIYTKRGICGKLSGAGFEILDSAYITAPMDVVRWRPMRKFLRSTLFRNDRTGVPWMSTAVLVVARRR